VRRILSRCLFFLGAFSTCVMMVFNTGCMSGSFRLTRDYARWVNSKNIIFRIILYILTFVVFAVTMIIDTVILNSIDFWDGKVAAGQYEFKEGEKTYQVFHEFQPGELRLKRSTITILDPKQNQLQKIVLNETASGEIELIVDGKIRSRVKDITTIPIVSIFDEKGSLIESKFMIFDMRVMMAQYLAKR
jgi:hypothetical protein